MEESVLIRYFGTWAWMRNWPLNVWSTILTEVYYATLKSIDFIVPSGAGRNIYRCMKLLKRSETFITLLTNSFLMRFWFRTGNWSLPQSTNKQ